MNRPDQQRIIAVVFLAILVLAAYWQVRSHEWIYFDDQLYVTDNRHVREGLTPASIRWAFTNTETGHWHPLTWLSHMLDYELYRSNPAGHYGTSLIIHLLNVLLLLFVLAKMTDRFWPSYMVAALFALHPLNVESVAWVAERKNVLSTTFWLSTMLCYRHYVQRPGTGRYVMLLIVFAFGLMTKPMLVTLPFVLLLLDFWPLGRTDLQTVPGRLIKEKIPLFVMALISAVITIKAAQSVGTIADLARVTLVDRIWNVVLSYALYIRKLCWPFDLAVFYPFPKSFSAFSVSVAALLLGAFSVTAWVRRHRYPFLLVGWLWYLGTLVPVIGFVQVGSQGMADRYAYVPMIGLFIIIAWGTPLLISGLGAADIGPLPEKLLPFAGVSVMLALSFLTWRQAGVWESNLSLFQHAIAVTEENQKAQQGMGLAWHARGRPDLAVPHLRESLRIRGDAGTYNDLGYVLMAMGKYPEAEEQFRASLTHDPGSAKVHNNLGASLAAQGRYREAEKEFIVSLQLDPHYAAAGYNLARMQSAGKELTGRSDGSIVNPR